MGSKKVSFNTKFFSFRSSDKRDSGLTKEVQGSAMIKSGDKVQESKISRRMVYLTNKRLMMVLILMLIFIPMFSTYFWQEITHAYETDLNFLAIYYR